MSKYLFFIIAAFFAAGCVPAAKKQWTSTIKAKPSELPVSKAFLDRVRANWYYNPTTKCYGVNRGFDFYFSNSKEECFYNLQKLNFQQAVAIFGQPDTRKDSNLIYLHIDYKTREKISYGYGYGTPAYYVMGIWNQKPILSQTYDGGEYYAQKLNYPEGNLTVSIDYFSEENRDKALKVIDEKAKKAMHNYFFYNKQARHYVWIDGLPLPQSCDSKAEVLRLFGKPSKEDADGSLIYYLFSLPNIYGRINHIRWSPQLNGKYLLEEKLSP